jgi:ribosomal protein L22
VRTLRTGGDVPIEASRLPETTVIGHNSQARLSKAEARHVLARVQGMTATEALWALRFAAGTVCAPVARIVAQAVVQAERTFGVGPDSLVITASEVGDGETIVRVRRQAHGTAGWITTETTDIRVKLRVVRGRQAHAR